MKPGYTYRVLELKVLDGDTIQAVIDLGLEVRTRGIFRLSGIDSPEKRGATREAGLAAQKRLEYLCTNSRSLTIRTYAVKTAEAREKYGRWLAEIFCEGSEVSFNMRLVQEGLARAYHGDARL